MSRRGVGRRGDFYGDARVILVGAPIVHKGRAGGFERKMSGLPVPWQECPVSRPLRPLTLQGRTIYIRFPFDRVCPNSDMRASVADVAMRP